jgi:polyisoprenyl-phosphate glycosyltransferase
MSHSKEDGYTKSFGSINIPTTNPEDALRFCRHLQQMLKENDESSKKDRVTGQASRGFLAGDPMNSVPPEISVVIPVYNEEGNLLPLYERLASVLTESRFDYEIIFVIDGSRDSSLQVVCRLANEDPRVAVVELARNFGHQIAISAGLDYAKGRGVVVMDSDLQDPPEFLTDLISKWKEGYDVVYAVRVKRKENIFKRAAYSFFYRLLNRTSNIQIPLNAGDFCIMDRRVVDILVAMPERNRFVRGIRSWVGFKQIGLICERQARQSGKPGYTLSRLIYLALDGLVSFSYLPLRVISILGWCVSIFSILLSIFYLIKKILFGLNPPGFATLVVAIFFLSGIQLITIGVIGEYVGRISEEVKQRPLYVVKQIIGKIKRGY